MAHADPARRRSWMVRAWQVVRSHLRGGDIPIEQLDIAQWDITDDGPQRPNARRVKDDVDATVDESFPASDPPSSTSSHA